jgi:hypothetical protein
MRMVLDTNIIVSALIAPAGKPAAIVDAWLDGKFTLPTCAAHVDELRATLQRARVAELVKPHKSDAWDANTSRPRLPRFQWRRAGTNSRSCCGAVLTPGLPARFRLRSSADRPKTRMRRLVPIKTSMVRW